MGAQCAISVTFRPGAAGVRKAILVVTDSAADSPQFAFLQGTGVVPNTPAVTLSPPSLGFGNQTMSTTSGASTVTLQNTGAAALSISSITIPDSTEFVVAANTSTNPPPCGTSVAGGASCTINVTFTPTGQTGFRSGTLTIADNGGGSPQQLQLTGTGVTAAAGAPSWNYAYPLILDFGNVPVYGIGVGSVAVGNATYATAPLTIIGCTTTGDFVVQNGCDGTLVPGETHYINIQVDPTHLGQQKGTLTVETNDSASPHRGNVDNNGYNLYVNGTGAPVASLPASLDAGNQPVSTTSGPKTVTLHNSGNVPLSIAGIAAGGEFAVASNTCGASLAAGASCTINITFTPAQLGARSGTLTVTDNASGGTQTVALSGAGTTAPPRVTHLSTLSVPVAGGTEVTVTGSGFQAGATVFFGDTAGTIVGTVTATSIVVATPQHAEGTVNVTVANPDGQYSDVYTGFSYIPPTGVGPPMVQPGGPPAGGGAKPAPAPSAPQPPGQVIGGSPPNPVPPSR